MFTEPRNAIYMYVCMYVCRSTARCTSDRQGPVIISRDHHDVSGTDSPYRETSNVFDGSAFTADMAVQNCIGDAFRGATWVALHNGGGVGWYGLQRRRNRGGGGG